MTRSDGRAAKGIAFLVTLCLSAPRISLADDRDEAGARVLFVQGRKLVDSGNYAEACRKFEESLQLDPGVGTSFNLADCEEHIGRTASAWTRFLDVAAATRAQGQLKKEQIARARAAALEPKLARFVVSVSSFTEGLLVERDGLPIGAASWGIPVPVDPGLHRVQARAPGRKDWSQGTAVPDGPTTVVVSVPALEPLPPGDAPPAAPATAPRLPQPSPANPSRIEPTAGRWPIAVVSLGALGTAALATSAILAIQMRSENEKATALCAGSICGSIEEKTRHDGLVDDAHRDRDLAYVIGGLGTAAFAVAAYLLWRPARAPSPNASPSRFSLLPTTESLAADFELDW